MEPVSVLLHAQSSVLCVWGPALPVGVCMPGQSAIQGCCCLQGTQAEGLGCVRAGVRPMPACSAGRTGRYWGIGTAQSAAQRAAFEQQLSKLAAVLTQHGGPYLLGAEPCLADINVYPFIKRFAVGMPQLCGYDVSMAAGGAVGAWLAAMDARPSCHASAADGDLLLRAYKQYMSLDFFDYDSHTVFQLHPHNAHALRA